MACGSLLKIDQVNVADKPEVMPRCLDLLIGGNSECRGNSRMITSRVDELGELSHAEKQVLDRLDTGNKIILGDGTLPEVGNDNRRVRAALLRIVLLGDGPDPKFRLHERGLHISGAWVSEKLDLEGCRDLPAISLSACLFDEALNLGHASLHGSLSLNDCVFPGLSAYRLEVSGGLSLTSSQVTGPIFLIGATLGGALGCSDASFLPREGSKPAGFAIIASHLNAAEGVYFGGSEIVGEVVFEGARIDDFIFDGSSIRGRKSNQFMIPGLAISAEGLETRGNVSLRGTNITGEVTLLGATIGGDLVCENAILISERDAKGNPLCAVRAERVQIRGNFFLCDSDVQGELRLTGAVVENSVDCSGAKLRAEKDEDGWLTPALDLHDATISGSLILRKAISITGLLNLASAEIGHIDDEPEAWPQKGNLILRGCRYEAFSGNAVDAASRLDWLERQNPTAYGAAYWPQPYEQLANVFRNMGLESEARTVLVAKERARWDVETQLSKGWRKPFNWIWAQLLRTIGYGYRPALALFPALIFVGFGTGLFYLGWEAKIIRPADANSLAATAPRMAFVPIAYSFEAFVPIVKLGQVEAFRPDMGKCVGYWLQVYIWLHGLVGWLIGGIAVAGVFGLFRRE